MLVRLKNHHADFVKADFYRDDTNIVPVIQFKDQTLSAALKSLAAQAHIKCILSARVDPGDPEKEHYLSLLWHNLTAKQAFAAICENYDLDVNTYPDTDIVGIEPAY